MASPTVKMVSAASSGISQPNSSSNAMTSSTVSRLSAPRSSMKLAFSVTLSASTPKCSTTIFFTRSPMSLIAATSWSFELGSTGQRPEPLRYRLDWFEASEHSGRERTPEMTPAPGAAPTKLGFGYHTSKGLTSAAASAGEPRQACELCSDHRHPAVHMQCQAGDIGRLLGGEIDRGRRHVRTGAEPACGH